MLVNIVMVLSRWGLYIRILLISSFLLIPIVKNVLENSKISCIAESSSRYALKTIGSNFNPSDAPGFVNLDKLHWVLLLEGSHFPGCFTSSTISLFPLAFKIYCDLNPIFLAHMIIIMIMGLCCFLIWSHLLVMHWDSIQDSIQVTSCSILISV